MSEVVYDMSAVVPQVIEFFKNHPELPHLQEIWEPIAEFIDSRQLTASLSNLEFAYRVQKPAIDKAIAAIPANEWKEKVVLPEFQKRKKARPKRQSDKPWGVSTTEWLHSR